jgi:hypothetical protein
MIARAKALDLAARKTVLDYSASLREWILKGQTPSLLTGCFKMTGRRSPRNSKSARLHDLFLQYVGKWHIIVPFSSSNQKRKKVSGKGSPLGPFPLSFE